MGLCTTGGEHVECMLSGGEVLSHSKTGVDVGGGKREGSDDTTVDLWLFFFFAEDDGETCKFAVVAV